MPAVEHVLLQQRGERLHGGIVAGRADSAHRSGLPMPVECGDEFPAAELRSAVGMHDAAGHVGAVGMAPGDGPVLRDPDASHLIDTLALLMSMSKASVAMITDVRMAVEPAVSGMAAERMSDRLLEDLRASVDDMRERLGQNPAFMAAGQRFHGLIASSTGNALFGYVVDSLIGIASTAAGNYDFSQQILVLALRRGGP